MLFILSLVGIFNMLDRQIIAILLEPIKQDLGVSDTAMGLLSGIAFAAFYVTAGIPLARIADRRSRRNLITACLAVWSLATALCGLVQSFLQLLLARIGVASGEAGAYPASQSMLADLYPASQRGTVIGVLLAAQSIGIAFGLFFGGWLNTAFSWRTAFVVVGLPGLVLALVLVLTVAEPPRGMTDPGPPDTSAGPTMGDAFRFIVRTPVMLLLLPLAAASSFSGYALLGWAPTFYIRTFGMSTMETGFLVGLFIASGLFIGNVVAGRLADHLARGDLSVYMVFAGTGSLLAVPFGALFALADGRSASLAGLFFANLIMCCWLPCTYAVALGLAPPRMRATVTAVVTLCMTLAGIGLGPLFVGAMNDLLASSVGEASIRYSLLLAHGGSLIGGVLCFVCARLLRQARAGAEN